VKISDNVFIKHPTQKIQNSCNWHLGEEGDNVEAGDDDDRVEGKSALCEDNVPSPPRVSTGVRSSPCSSTYEYNWLSSFRAYSPLIFRVTFETHSRVPSDNRTRQCSKFQRMHEGQNPVPLSASRKTVLNLSHTALDDAMHWPSPRG